MKKIISCLLCLSLMLGLMAGTAFALGADCVMTVDGKEYTDFEKGWNDALAATANNDNTVKVVLYENWYADENGSFGEGKGFRKGAIYISEDTKDMLIDLNGCVIDRGLFAWDDFDKDPTVDKARSSGEVLQIDAGSKRITVRNGTIRGANNKDDGGVFLDDDVEVSFQDVTFTSNKATNGGAIYLDSGSVSLYNCTFENNFAKQAGGAFYGSGTTLLVRGSVFEHNKAADSEGKTGNGGAISVNGDVTIDDCKFLENEAWRDSGALNHRDGDLYAKNTLFEGNKVFNENKEYRAYSGVGSFYCDFVMEGCSFVGNSAEEYGVAYTYREGSFVDCEFRENMSEGSGGQGASVLFINSTSKVKMTDCTITDNIGTCAIFADAKFSSHYWAYCELWLDGVMQITGNKNEDGGELNVCFEEEGIMASSIYLQEDFSKESRVGVGVNGDDMLDEEAVEKIPSGWSVEDRAKSFRMDPVFLNGKACAYYLKSDGNSLVFTKKAEDSIHSGMEEEEEEEPAPVVYSITVENGSVNADSAAAGSTMTVEAQHQDENLIFVRWESADVTFADPEAAVTTFVMPEQDVALQAVFSAKPAKPIASHASGHYDSPFDLVLTSPDGVDILFGSGEEGTCEDPYEHPLRVNFFAITPELGEDGYLRNIYYINAKCVNEYGLMSDLMQVRYHIGAPYLPEGVEEAPAEENEDAALPEENEAEEPVVEEPAAEEEILIEEEPAAEEEPAEESAEEPVEEPAEEPAEELAEDDAASEEAVSEENGENLVGSAIGGGHTGLIVLIACVAAVAAAAAALILKKKK